MNRREDWPERLETYVNSVRDKKHDWEKHNCLIFSDGAVEAVTGENYYKEYLSQFDKSVEDIFEEIGVKDCLIFCGQYSESPYPQRWPKEEIWLFLKSLFSRSVSRGRFQFCWNVRRSSGRHRC